jgi:HAMP domain-containing protein
VSDQVANTDYSKHTDDELRDGINSAEQNLARIAQEGTDEQREAATAQRDAMQAELDKRQS